MNGRSAVLSDIHANWEALETAADYCRKQKIGQFLVLGDTIGYGANPNECFRWVLENASAVILGNHEKAMLDVNLRREFNDWAREASDWTAEVLAPELKKEIPKLAYLKIENGVTLAHGSPDNPEEFRYLMSYSDARPSFGQMETQICFVGHTHVPSCFLESAGTAFYLGPGVQTLKKNERTILNPGSVGQPRDQDKRLSFGIWDPEKWTFEIVRLEYDKRTAAEKIRKAGLPPFLADRLL